MFGNSLSHPLSPRPTEFMDDQQRLTSLLTRLKSLEGIEQQLYDRLLTELERPAVADGCDEQGRLRVAMYDAKSYDIQSFGAANQDRFALRPIRASLSMDTVAAASGARVICIFVNDCCDAGVAEQLASLGVRLVALRCAGHNNVDIPACRELGIDVVHVPSYSPHAVAEHTVALMLMLNRHLHLAYARNRASTFLLEGLIGFDMRGKTVGVVGTGRIGQCVIDILSGFGCQVLAFDKFPNKQVQQEGAAKYVELDALLARCDILSLHVPLLPETHHLINARTIERMKPGVMLINTSRGGLVDTPALIDGLKSGQIGFAGLDVYEEEAGIFFHDMSDRVLTDDVLARLMTFNNVVITSHQAFLTNEALENIASTTLESIAEYGQGLRGEKLTYRVKC